MKFLVSRTGVAGLVLAFGLLAAYLIWLQLRANPIGTEGLGLATTSEVASQGLTPNPGFAPNQVVAIQLDALQHNDEPAVDTGIAVAFRFASPANKRGTGPLPHFKSMIFSPAYLPLVNHRSVVFGPTIINGRQALQHVQVVAGDGTMYWYTYLLSLQSAPPFFGCWMIDGVMLNDAAPAVEPPPFDPEWPRRPGDEAAPGPQYGPRRPVDAAPPASPGTPGGPVGPRLPETPTRPVTPDSGGHAGDKIAI